MSKPKVTFAIEGPDGNNGHLELSVFAEKIRHFLHLLNENAKEEGAAGVAFHVVHLSHSSPAIIECEPVAGNVQADAAVHAVGRSLLDVKEKNAQNLSHAVLSSMEQLVKFSATKVAWAEIGVSESDDESERIYKLDDRFKEQLSLARHQEDRIFSTIDGRLEQINIHNNVNTFRIYTSLPTFDSVNCRFPPKLLEKVQSSLGAFVSVSGECFYRPEAPFPYKINVQGMKVLPPTEELPTLSDLYGIAPGATGDKSSEQFVRELRDEWGGAEKTKWKVLR